MQVGKISLYAASSAIKEVQKLVLDPKYANFTLVLAIALVLSLPTSLSLKMENKLFCLTDGSYSLALTFVILGFWNWPVVLLGPLQGQP